MMPFLAKGRTTFQVVSQRVAPSASAPSRCSVGTARITSREIEMMNGMIITGQHHARRKHADAVERSREQGRPAQQPADEGLRRFQHGYQNEDPEQSENHAGDGSQQFDQEGEPIRNLGGGELSQKDRRAHAQRDSHEQGQRGRHHRAINER